MSISEIMESDGRKMILPGIGSSRFKISATRD